MMTLREIMTDVLRVNETPGDALIGALQILRTINQGGREAATLEGCVASAEAWTELYGEITTANVLRWIENIKAVADLPIPERVILTAIEADD